MEIAFLSCHVSIKKIGPAGQFGTASGRWREKAAPPPYGRSLEKDQY
jgi:hypothetical protein